jgi:hypothetical protein
MPARAQRASFILTRRISAKCKRKGSHVRNILTECPRRASFILSCWIPAELKNRIMAPMPVR